MKKEMKIYRLLLVIAAMAVLGSCSEVFDNGWSASSAERTLKMSKQQFSFTSAAQTENTEVTAQNVPWTISNNAQWLTISPNSGSASASVAVAVQENTSDTARVAYPMMSSTDAQWTQTYPMTVTQRAPEPYINISDQSLVFGGTSGSQTVSVESNYKVRYTKTEKWLTLEETSTGVKVSVEENTDEGDRSADIIVTAGTKTEKILVTQRAANVSSTISTMEFANAASTKELVIDAQASWTATATDQWIQITPTSGKAGYTTVKVSVTDNTENIDRNGFVYINIGTKRKLEIAVQQNGTVLSASPTFITLNANGEAATFNVTGNTSWTLTASDPWIELSKTAGSNNAQITVSAPKNTSNERRGTITLHNKQGNVASLINVTQETGRASVTAMPRSFNLGVEESTSSLNIFTEGAWSLKTDAEWIMLSQTSGTGETTVEVTVTKNMTASVRNGNIMVYDQTGAEVQKVPVRQTTFDISATVSELTLQPEGSTETFDINATSQWQLTAPEWLTLSQTTGNSNATIEVKAVENNSGVDKKGSILLFNEAGVQAQSIAVTQPAVSIKVSPETFDFKVAGETQTMTINSNVAWTASTNSSWLTLSNASGTSSADIMLSAKENTNSTARTATVTVQSKSGKVKATAKVTQIGSQIAATPTAMTFGVDGATEDLTIVSNTKWSLSADVTWLKLGKTSGTGDDRVSVTAIQNPNDKKRSATISVKNSLGTVVQTVAVDQVATNLAASPGSLAFAPVGETAQLTITANSDWSLSASSWLTLSKTSGSGNATLNVTVAENTSASKRSGQVLLKNSVGTTVQTIAVTQDAYTLTLSPTELYFDPAAGVKSFAVATNTSWTVLSTVPWVTIANNSGTKDGTVRVQVSANDGDSQRNATVSVVAGNLQKNVTITQGYTERFAVSPSSLSFNVSGSQTTLKITSNSSWRLTTTSSWLSLSKTMGTGNDNVTVNATENTGNQVRTATISLENASGMTVATVEVVQTASSLSATLSETHFVSEGTQTNISISADAAWRLKVPEWTSVNMQSGNGDATVRLTVSANTSRDKRYGTVTLTNAAGVTYASIDIEQDGRTTLDEYTKDLGYTFLSKGSTLELTAIENEAWTAQVTNGSWIALSPASGSATTNLAITAADNPSGKGRQGEIQITYGYNRYTCPVVQDGKTITVSTNNVEFFAKGGEISSIIVTADKTAEVKTAASWLTIKQSGNTFTLTATKNSSSSQRNATVTVSLPGVTDLDPVTITVRQTGPNGTFSVNGFGKDENWN